jgi:PAS domain S-box-containing protein
VWLSKQWEWDDDGTADPSVTAADQAIKRLPSGHRANVAMPVLVDDEVVAVLEFFVLAGGSQDQRSLDRVAAVVSRVGLWMSIKGAEDAGRRSEQKFRQIAETTTDAIVFASADSRILYLNPAAQTLFGYSADESHGRLIAELVRDRTQPNGDATLGRYTKLGQGGLTAPPIYLTAVRKDGGEIPVEVTLTRWNQGEETFLTTIVRDSSERVHTEQRLRDALGVERKALGELQVLDNLKYTVLQALAHDLRTPLSTVLILTSLLRADPQRGRALSPLERGPLLIDIERSVRQMQRILQDLLDSDPQQSLAARRGPCDVGELVTRVLAENGLAATHPVHTAIDSVMINIDAAQVERIVDNLLNNAARHVAVGVSVWLKTTASEDGVLISVEDAGEGVPADMSEEIFEPFRRGTGATATGAGMGLGLSLVSRFAQLHGGRAWVEDRPGGGASFNVHLPNSEVAAFEPKPAPEAKGPVRVLLCDDDQILRDALGMLIRSDARLELVGEPVQTGREVIDAVVRHLPDVVLMDVELIGEMNGFEATSQIRELCPTTTVVIMSGVADPTAAAIQAIQAGAAAFLPKSQDADSILDAVLAAAHP